MTNKKLRIVFVNYGGFRSNSGGHIANFANQLNRLGHIVAVCATGDPVDPENGLDSSVFAYRHEDVLANPEAIRTCGEGAEATLFHFWTPREKIIRLQQILSPSFDLPVFVHLEDNEDVISATNLMLDVDSFSLIDPQRLPNPFPESISHPYRFRAFLKQVAGVTTIVDRLGEFAPPGVKTLILEPGVDHELFCDRLDQKQKLALRASLGISPASSVFVYHGNMHAANQREIFSLYTAALILGRRGRDVRLIRTGLDFTDGLDQSYGDPLQDLAIQLGYVSIQQLVEVLSIADFYIQPGASNPFNDYRFPSKLPEFLAMGRPTVLPNANIARRLRDGVDALFLDRGDGVEIAGRVEHILDNPELAKMLGTNARKFAMQSLNWERNAKKLLDFYFDNL